MKKQLHVEFNKSGTFEELREDLRTNLAEYLANASFTTTPYRKDVARELLDHINKISPKQGSEGLIDNSTPEDLNKKKQDIIAKLSAARLKVNSEGIGIVNGKEKESLLFKILDGAFVASMTIEAVEKVKEENKQSINNSKRKVIGGRTKIRRLIEKERDDSRELATLRTRVECYEEVVSSLNRASVELSDNLDRAQGKVREMEGHVKYLQKQLEVEKKKGKRFQDDLVAKEGEIESLGLVNKALTAEVTTLKNFCEKLNKIIDELLTKIKSFFVKKQINAADHKVCTQYVKDELGRSNPDISIKNSVGNALGRFVEGVTKSLVTVSDAVSDAVSDKTPSVKTPSTQGSIPKQPVVHSLGSNSMSPKGTGQGSTSLSSITGSTKKNS